MLHSHIHLNWIGTAPWRVKWSEAISNFEMDLQFCLVCYRTAPIIYLCYSFGTNERMESRGRGLTSSRLYSTVHWNRDQDGNPIQSNPWVYIYIYIHCNLFILLDFDFDFDHDDEPIVRFCVVRFFLYTTWF